MQSSPQTVLGAEALLSSLRRDPGSPQKHEVMKQQLPLMSSHWESYRHYWQPLHYAASGALPAVYDEDPEGHKAHLPVNNEAGLRIQVSPDSKDHTFPVCYPNCVNSLEGSQGPQSNPLFRGIRQTHGLICQSGSDLPSLQDLSLLGQSPKRQASSYVLCKLEVRSVQRGHIPRVGTAKGIWVLMRPRLPKVRHERRPQY